MAENDNITEKSDITALAGSMEDAQSTITLDDLIKTTQEMDIDFRSTYTQGIVEEEELPQEIKAQTAATQVIEDNSVYNRIQRDVMLASMTLGLQQAPPLPGETENRFHNMMGQDSVGFPAELNPEKLPPNLGGAVPPASQAFSRMKGPANIKTGKNPYGYA